MTTTTVEIDADIATVWDAVGNPETWPAWDPGVKAITASKPGSAPAVGTEYATDGGWLNNQVVTIVDYREREAIGIDAQTTDGRFRFDYVLEGLPDGRVSATLTMAPQSFGAEISGALAWWQYESSLVKLGESLRDYCEAQAPHDPVRG